MRTCRVLYEIGIRRLLQFGVTISSESQLLAFSHYISHSPSTRAPLLRRLRISIQADPYTPSVHEIAGDGEIGHYMDSDGDSNGEEYSLHGDNNNDEDTLENGGDLKEDKGGGDAVNRERSSAGVLALAQILRLAGNLEDLRLGYLEELLQSFPIKALSNAAFKDEHLLLGAVATLTSIKHLHLASFGTLALALFKSVTSPLVEVDIKFRLWKRRMINPNILHLLSKYCATLEKITVWHVDIHEDFVQLSNNTPRFPRVHTLCIRQPENLSLSVLLHAFPNLQSLDVTGLFDAAGVVDDTHDENRELDDSQSLVGLRYLSGDIITLYALGLTRDVERLDISEVDLSLSDEMMLETILDGARPTTLLLRIGYPLTKWHGPMVLVEELVFVPTLYTRVTHLALDNLDIYMPLLRPPANDPNVGATAPIVSH